MKRLVISLMTAMFAVVVLAQDVKVEFITPSIVHIVKGQPTKTLVITAKPQETGIRSQETGGIWKSSDLRCARRLFWIRMRLSTAWVRFRTVR